VFVHRTVLAASLLLNLVLAYNLVWGKSGAIAYMDLRERRDVLENRIAAAGEENLALSREIRLLQSDAKYIEKTIRNRLNFVRGNEILYIFPPEESGERLGVPADEAKN
jgi:cell division protein FtsB